MKIETISMQELYQRSKQLAQGEVILDVRSAEEFQAGHVPGAINIPHDRVGEHLARLKAFAKVYIHCQAGGRAGVAAAALSNAVLSNLVCITGGGMGDWIAAGLPVA
jgi:hydroxyacylglutathione hydrolase